MVIDGVGLVWLVGSLVFLSAGTYDTGRIRGMYIRNYLRQLVVFVSVLATYLPVFDPFYGIEYHDLSFSFFFLFALLCRYLGVLSTVGCFPRMGSWAIPNSLKEK